MTTPIEQSFYVRMYMYKEWFSTITVIVALCLTGRQLASIAYFIINRENTNMYILYIYSRKNVQSTTKPKYQLLHFRLRP